GAWRRLGPPGVSQPTRESQAQRGFQAQQEFRAPRELGPRSAPPARLTGAGRVIVAGLLGFLLAVGGGVVGGYVMHQVDTRDAGVAANSTANPAAPTSVQVMDRSSLADI